MQQRVFPEKCQKNRAGFTLIETVIGIAILAFIIGGTALYVVQLNDTANLSRIHTAAQTAAQNQLDRALNDLFIPQFNSVSAVLETGTHYYDPLDTDGDGDFYSVNPVTIPIFIDPVTNETLVSGTAQVQVSDPGITQDGTTLKMRLVTVTVDYTYRGDTRSTTMRTLRASDL